MYAAEGIRAEVVKCKEKKISKNELRKIRKIKKAIRKKKNQIRLKLQLHVMKVGLLI